MKKVKEPLKDVAEDVRLAVAKMRAVLGRPNAPATVCETAALVALGKRSPRKNVIKSYPISIVEQIQTILGNSTMQSSEIVRALREAGAVSVDLRGLVQNTLSKQCTHRRGLRFVRVRHGWYRNRIAGDKVNASYNKLPFGAMARIIYDVLKGNRFNSAQILPLIARRIPANRRRRDCISAVLDQHSDTRGGYACFRRVSIGVYTTIPKRRP